MLVNRHSSSRVDFFFFDFPRRVCPNAQPVGDAQHIVAMNHDPPIVVGLDSQLLGQISWAITVTFPSRVSTMLPGEGSSRDSAS